MQEKESEPLKNTINRNKGGYTIRTIAVKKQAVVEYERREIPLKEILAKYGVCITTLWNWHKQFGSSIELKKVYSGSFKLQVVREIVLGNLSYKNAMEKHGIKYASSIKKWCMKYSTQIREENQESMSKKVHTQTDQEDQIAMLQKALNDSNLKVLGLETMIDIAEKELKIEIRKKSGTKQLK